MILVLSCIFYLASLDYLTLLSLAKITLKASCNSFHCICFRSVIVKYMILCKGDRFTSSRSGNVCFQFVWHDR